MMKKQHYMTKDEREKLEALLQADLSVAQIAGQLGFCRQTIYNEIKTGTYLHTCANLAYRDEERYSAQKSESIHRNRQTAKGRPLKIGHDREYADFLEHKIIKDRYSPAAALAAARKAGYQTSVCTATLYSYIDKGIFLRLSNRHLWIKSKRKKQGYHPVRRIVHPELPSIADRPDYVNSREELGHWEMDLVVSRNGSRSALLTLTERTMRQELIFKLPDKKAETVRSVFDRLERHTPNFREVFKSITTDNGPEFLEYAKLQHSIYGGRRFQIYYCHSYAAWEKGSNENQNRMIRRFFPKGTDFSKVSRKRITAVQEWMNDYPRKSLDWLSANEFHQLAA
jgi:IS30 family transposase